MQTLNIIITGGNRGIGLELTRQLLQKGHKISVLCRKTSPELNACGCPVIQGIDMEYAESIKNGVAQIKQANGTQKVDILINNAGIFTNETLGNFDTEKISRQLQINATSPLLLAQLMTTQMNLNAKMIFITSRMGSIADNTSGAYYGYRMSKAALNAGVKSLSIDLNNKNIAVALIHPGFVKTDMTHGQGDITAEVAASGIIQRIEQLNIASTGGFWHANGEKLPW